jgi:hypothetical protein
LALCASAATARAAVGPDEAAVAAAVAAAKPGDTVEVAPGKAAWTKPLTIARGITLKGAGIDKTIIALPAASISIVPNAAAIANNEVIEISGFTFDDGSGKTSGELIDISAPHQTPFRGVKIHDNKFTRIAYSCRAFRVSGGVYGVVYSNQFDTVGMIIGSMGSGNTGAWATDYPKMPSYGDGNKLFLEDNSWYASAPADTEVGWVETGQGCPGIIVRYNTWDHANVSDKWREQWDVHGLQSGTHAEQYSTLSAEYYGNITTNWHTNGRLMLHRGSWLMMFNNLTGGKDSKMPSISFNEYACDEHAAWEKYPQHINNTYVWNNLWNGRTVQNMVKGLDNCRTYTITENRDYFNYDPKFDGTSGIGCGPTVPTTNCRPGAGYWVTSHSPADRLPSTMAELKTVTQAGRFYKCTAPNTWTLYYRPYAYPHPLRGQ